MLDLGPYLSALVGVTALCLLAWLHSRSGALLRCLGAVLAVWVAGVAYSAFTGDFTHWAENIVIDGIAARMILRHPAGKMQAALGGTYAVQVAMHVAYGARETWTIADPIAYYDMLTIVAYAQLAILGGWALGTWGQFVIDRLRRHRPAMDHREGVGGMGRKA